MGYYIHQVDAYIDVRQPQADEVRRLHTAHVTKDGHRDAHFDIEEDGYGKRDITGLNFLGQKSGHGEEEELRAIAPAMPDGNYVEFQGEDGERWRWAFHKGKLVELTSKLEWAELPTALETGPGIQGEVVEPRRRVAVVVFDTRDSDDLDGEAVLDALARVQRGEN